ncbi:MAG: type II secretion system protein [Desulfobulbus propionicus]|nr:MAG: type II secretion system protein [Desulfobulbus propionicus]
MSTSATTISSLLDYLLVKGLIQQEDAQKAASLTETGGRPASVLLRLGALSEDSLLHALAEFFNMPVVEAGRLEQIWHAAAQALRQSGTELDWWLDQGAIIWEETDGIACAVLDPFNPFLREFVQKKFPHTAITFFLIRTYDLERIHHYLQRTTTQTTSSEETIDQLREMAEEAPVIDFVNNLIAQAFEQRASDIHVEPGEHQLEIRFRVDGILSSHFTLPIERYAAIASRIKLISGMDIAEKRLPQDGRLEVRLSGGVIDVRISSTPGITGESIVLRLLPKTGEKLNLTSLGMSVDYLALFKQLIREPHGIILVTGPTGSGKSTTLYSVLEEVNDGLKKIITVEDPVEYHISGVTQIQTHAEIGYTFAHALRSILRQDPDIILIGEIRDRETAEIAVQASLTGHLVFSTLHTNDSLSAFTRLIDMGLEPFLVATPIRAVLAQRLVRKLCVHCAKPREPVQDILQMAQEMLPDSYAQTPSNWLTHVGCPRCQGTGYRGREAIYELIEVTPEMQHLIVNNAPLEKLRQGARQQHFRNLRADGLLKAWLGITSVDEVIRVTSV